MVETKARFRPLLLLRAEVQADGTYHGPFGADRARRQICAGEPRARVQGMQQQQKISPPQRMGGVSGKLKKRITGSVRAAHQPRFQLTTR